MYRILSIFLVFVFSSIRLAECGIKIYADEQLNEDCLYVHNKLRAQHENTPPLKMIRNATDYALARIKTLAKIDNFGVKPQDGRINFGENFYWYYDTKQYHNCEHAVKLWYSGSTLYDFNRPGFHEKTGGFSQIVWKNSQYLGCATVLDNTRQYLETYFLCAYWPPGNVDRQYPYNVFPVKKAGSHSSGSGDYDPERPTVNRPDAHKPIPPVVKPELPEPSRPTVNRPDQTHRPGTETWVEQPAQPVQPIQPVQPSRPNTDWATPSRPIIQNQNNKPIVSMPPVPPTYPLILLHPLLK